MLLKRVIGFGTTRFGCRSSLVRRNSALSHIIIGPDLATETRTPKTALIIHGLLGSKQNWNSFTRRLSKAHPSWKFVCVDLRGHGDTQHKPPPHSLEACARDVELLICELGLPHPSVVMGHSFGGKVSLIYSKVAAISPRQVWVLDTLPGETKKTSEGGEDSSVKQVISNLRRVPIPVKSRSDIIGIARDLGMDQQTGSWMTTNLRPTKEAQGFEWKFDLDIVEDLFEEYNRTCTWHVLEQPPHGTFVDVIAAGKNPRWTAEIRDRFSKISESGAEVTLHTLEAGHWVHVDNPDGLFDIVSPSLLRLL